MTAEIEKAVPAELQEARELYEGVRALRQTIAPTLTDAELELFALIAKRKGLDPFSGQIVAVKRNTRQGARVAYQTGIDGYRSLAERTHEYLGSDLPDFGPPCGCGTGPSYHPEWATVVVHRLHPSGLTIDQPARAKWHEFVPQDAFMWGEKPEVMLGKCAEAQALRKAFPWVLGDLYIPEEMARADEADTTSAGPVQSARESVAARAAAIRGEASPTVSTAEGTLPPVAATAAAGADEELPAPVVVAEGQLTIDDVELEANAPAPMSAPEFGAAVDALGSVTRERVRERAAELFPEKRAVDMTPADWGQLYAELVAETVAQDVPG